MSVSEQIRALAHEGLSTTEIALRLEIRYQHAYNVLKAAGTLPIKSSIDQASSKLSKLHTPKKKPPLSTDILIKGGFTFAGHWVLSGNNDLIMDQDLPNLVGVYAFAKNGIALYIGVATMGLAKRLYFYRKPGVTQRTSQRLNGIIKNELLTVPSIDVYIALPSDLEWNGLPVHGSAGLELGLIKKYELPWNMRSAG